MWKFCLEFFKKSKKFLENYFRVCLKEYTVVENKNFYVSLNDII